MGDPDMEEQQVPDDLETADELIADRTERPGETPEACIQNRFDYYK